MCPERLESRGGEELEAPETQGGKAVQEQEEPDQEQQDERSEPGSPHGTAEDFVLGRADVRNDDRARAHRRHHAGKSAVADTGSRLPAW